jgi:hypothetical protein
MTTHLAFGGNGGRKPQLSAAQIAQLDKLSGAGISRYTYGILRRTRTTLAELLCMTRRDVMDLRGMGPGRCRELQLVLAELGYEWPPEEAESNTGAAND